MLATERAVMPDNALRNILRRVPNNSVLYLPGLDYANWHTGIIKDYSGLGNDGTIVGATPVRLPSGLWALSYDGDDFVNIGDKATLDITGDLTIFGWVYVTDLTQTAVDIFSKISAAWGADGYALAVRNTGRLDLFTSQAAASQQTTGTNGDILVNTWYFCMGTRSGAVGKVYQGSAAGFADKTNVSGVHVNPTPAGQTAYVGGHTGLASPLKGREALVGVLNVALTATEGEGIFNQGRYLFNV